jgi:hypothetical protein
LKQLSIPVDPNYCCVSAGTAANIGDAANIVMAIWGNSFDSCRGPNTDSTIREVDDSGHQDSNQKMGEKHYWAQAEHDTTTTAWL